MLPLQPQQQPQQQHHLLFETKNNMQLLWEVVQEIIIDTFFQNDVEKCKQCNTIEKLEKYFNSTYNLIISKPTYATTTIDDLNKIFVSTCCELYKSKEIIPSGENMMQLQQEENIGTIDEKTMNEKMQLLELQRQSQIPQAHLLSNNTNNNAEILKKCNEMLEIINITHKKINVIEAKIENIETIIKLIQNK